MCPLPPTLRYEPSAWESAWRLEHAPRIQIDRSRSWEQGCEAMRSEPAATVEAWLEFVRLRRRTWRGAQLPVPSEAAARALSFHVLVDPCTNQTLMRLPIEPLVGYLRHPEAHCMVKSRYGYWAVQQSKGYLIPAWHQEAWPSAGRQTSAFLLDLGASTYSKGLGGASTKWFVDEYRARGIDFHHIYAWEAKFHLDADIYGAMPFAIVDRTSYYNLPVDAQPGAKHNPWRTLRDIATPRDFVVVKIDIDNSSVEEPLVAQLLKDRSLARLVDELYFEHHVRNTPMWSCCWRQNTVTTHTLVHSYDVFTRLRQMGIRAHSWV